MAGNEKNHGDAGVSPPHIPAELVEEILTRLPIIDLYAARCVCTLWRSITTSPEFLPKHHRRNQNPPQLGLLISTADAETKEFMQFQYARLHGGDVTNPSPFVCRRKFSYSEYSGTTQVIDNLVCLYTTDRASLLDICTGDILPLPEPPYHPSSRSHFYLGYKIYPNKIYKIVRQTKINTPSDFIKPLLYEILTVTIPVSSCKWRKVDFDDGEDDCLSHSLWANGTSLYLASSSSSHLKAFDLHKDKFPIAYLKLSSERKVLQCRYGLGSIDVSLRGKRLNYYPPKSFLSGGYTTLDLPDELCADLSEGLLPVGFLPNGDILLAHDGVNDRVTPVYSLNLGSKRFKRFVVGKFPWSVASMTDMERASRITCIQEDLTPLQGLQAQAQAQAYAYAPARARARAPAPTRLMSN